MAKTPKLKKEPLKKLFVVRKYIWAVDVEEALKKESKEKVDDIYVDEEWKRMSNQTKDSIGFYVPTEE